MNIDSFREKLFDLLNESAKDMIDHEGALCTNFILVSEFVDANGEYWTLTTKDEQQPPWRTAGLMQYILETEFGHDSEEE